MGRLTFQILDQQRQEWFIVGRSPHNCVVAKGSGNFNETRGSVGRRYWRNDTSSYAVGFIYNSTSRAYQWKATTRTNAQHPHNIWQLERQIHYSEEDTTRSVRNGVIILVSVHYSRNITVLQKTCFAIFASEWDMKSRPINGVGYV